LQNEKWPYISNGLTNWHEIWHVLCVHMYMMQVKKAFIALIYNGVRAAPLWDSVQQNYVGESNVFGFLLLLNVY